MYYHSLGLAAKGERLHKCLHFTASTLHWGRALALATRDKKTLALATRADTSHSD